MSSHLVALATGGMELGALTAMIFGFREREELLDLYELITGLRMNSAYVRPGGVAQDLPPGAVDAVADAVTLLRHSYKDMAALLVDNGVWMARTEDVGYLDLSGCMALGITGPMLRATGLPWDLRKSQPYCGYEGYEFDVPTRDTCDAYGRFLIRLAELGESLKIVEQCLDKLTSRSGHGRGPQDRLAGSARTRRRRPRQQPRPHPPHHGRVDGGPDPSLQAGHRGLLRARRARPMSRSSRRAASSASHVVSDGGTRPYRVHFRDPSFTTSSRPRRSARAARSPTSSLRSRRSTRSWVGWTADMPLTTETREQLLEIAAPLSRSRGPHCSRCCTSCRPRRATSRPDGIAALRRRSRPRHRRGRCGRDVLHDVQAASRRRLPRRRLHEHAVRRHGRRRHLRGAEGTPRRRQRRDHRGRQASRSSTSSATPPATSRP